MFESIKFTNTRAIFSKTINDIKLIKNVCSYLEIFAFALSILYQTYMLSTRSNVWYAHLILLILSAAHFVYKLSIKLFKKIVKESNASVFLKSSLKMELNSTSRLANRIYKTTSLLTRSFIIAVSVYSITVAPEIFKVICTILIAAELLVEILFNLLVYIFERRIYEIKQAINTDIANFKSFFKNPFSRKSATENDENMKGGFISKIVNFFNDKKGRHDYVEEIDYQYSEEADNDEEYV